MTKRSGQFLGVCEVFSWQLDWTLSVSRSLAWIEKNGTRFRETFAPLDWASLREARVNGRYASI